MNNLYVNSELTVITKEWAVVVFTMGGKEFKINAT